MSVNRVVLTGRLTADPEVRTTNSGRNFVTFNLAVQKARKVQDGESAADFFKIMAWGASAKYVEDYLTKGRLIACDGKLQTRRWQDQNGVNRESVEIVVDNVNALDRGKRKATSHDDDYDPFAEAK